MTDCIFCKLAAGDIPTSVVYEDEQVFAFKDNEPKAPVHILMIPRKHFASLAEATAEDEALLGHIQLVAQKLAVEFGIDQSGYRVLTNCGPDSGQGVFHIHYHLLGGENLGDICGF